MSQQGFRIRRLALTGPPSMQDAELLFEDGLNVISGPSDTGKTFAFQCIDFVLGASSLPKSIPEAEGYESLHLDIYDCRNDKTFSLSRSLKGGEVLLADEHGHEQVLAEKHKADDPNSVSQWLLRLSDLDGKRIRKDAKGATRSFSFRDMAHLSVVSESDIIRDGSPLFSGQFIKKTEEESVYRFLLSGVDDSSIVQSPDKKGLKQHAAAKEEVLEQLIARVDVRIAETELPADLEVLTNQLREAEESIEQVTQDLHETRESADLLHEARRSAWIRLKQVESRLNVLSELQVRFSLLDAQYASDISRLQAIAETGYRLGEMALDYCPVCGASTEHADISHQECQIDPLLAAESCASEIQRINGLIADLGATRADIEREVYALANEKSQVQDGFEEANSELEENLNPDLEEAISQLGHWRDQRERLGEVVALFAQKAELEELLVQVKGLASSEAESASFDTLDPSYTEAFAKLVEERLTAWSFPSLDRVTFDEKARDILISGRSRTSHGKGVRAVTHAAFTLSLLRYCLDKGLPHSGVVVLDSPLVVYRQPDIEEKDFSEDVKSAFFRDLCESFEDAQIIIIENETPPSDVVEGGKANIVTFTGTSVGRSGFIPSPRHSGMEATE